MLTKRRIVSLAFLTVVFALFFVFFRSYLSQSVMYSLSQNTASFQVLHHTDKKPTSQYQKSSFTGAFEIRSIQSISGDVFDPKKQNNFQYYLEYPEFTYISDTPIQNFLKAQYRQAQRDLKTISEAEFNASFQGFSSPQYTSIIYSLFYHRNVMLPYQRMHMFLLNSSGAYISPGDLISISSSVDFTQIIAPYVRRQGAHVFVGDTFSDGISHFIAHPIFAFDGSDVILFFEAGIIAPRNQGNISVRIPYEQVKKFISKHPKKIRALKEILLGESQNNSELSRLSKDGKKYVALTFDDGPNSTSTVKLLGILRQKGVKATFFVLGQNAQKYTKVLKQIHEEGHEIEGHSWDHTSFVKLSKEQLREQIEKTDQVIKNVTGSASKFVRPPYGAYNAKVRTIIGKPLLMWSVDPKDWRYRNIEHNITSTLKQTKNGSIILYHDIHDVSVRTIPRLIDELRMRGYEFTTVEKLFLKYQSEVPSGDVVCLSGDRCK